MSKKFSKKIIALILTLTTIFMLSGCSSSGISSIDSGNSSTATPTVSAGSTTTTPGTTVTDDDLNVTVVPAETLSVTLPDSASEGEAAEADTVITLNGDSISVSGEGATVDGTTVTITSAGSYLISGTLNDGQIIVNTTDEKKVVLILNGVDITCSDNAPIYIISSPKHTLIYLQEGSVNMVQDGSTYNVDSEDSDAPSAAIFSKDDLKFDGTGTLYVTGNYNKGIFTKDDLEINGGTIYVTAVDDGIRGKDSITITAGTITIEAGGDGLRTSNETDTDKGWIQIDGGTISIVAALDGIQAVTDLTINGGTIIISSGGGSANASTKTNSDWGNWGGGFNRNQQSTSTTTTTETDSAKGLKATNSIIINDGYITIDSSDDSVHTNNLVTINGGTLYITSGDDGVHADTTLNIAGGIITVAKSYEGYEAATINISGGVSRVTASDDGVNAAGGTDSSSTTTTGGRQGGSMFSSSTGTVVITGGYLVINATGDGLDSNGSVTMSDGTVIIYGPTDNGNGALDYDSTFTMTGGTLVALGSTGMAQTVSNSGQGSLAFKVTLSAGTILHIEDSNGNEIFTIEAAKTAGCVVISTPDLVIGDTYTIYSGGSYSTTDIDGVYTGGTYTAGTELGSLSAN